MEFNDTNVTVFDSTKLAQECFGTQKRTGQSEPLMWERHCNAYLLFYQRASESASTPAPSLPLVDNQSMHNSEEEDADENKLINNVHLPLY